LEYQDHLSRFHNISKATCQLAPGHETLVKFKKRYVCPECSQFKKTMKDLRVCIATHKKVPEENVEQVPEEEAPEDQALLNPKKFTCPEVSCGFSYKIKKSMQAHARKSHGIVFRADKAPDWTSSCRHCCRKFKQESVKQDHEKKCKARPEAIAEALLKPKKKRLPKQKTAPQVEPAGQDIIGEQPQEIVEPANNPDPIHVQQPIESYVNLDNLDSYGADVPFPSPLSSDAAETSHHVLPSHNVLSSHHVLPSNQVLPFNHVSNHILPSHHVLSSHHVLPSHQVLRTANDLIYDEYLSQSDAMSNSQKSHLSFNSIDGMISSQ